MLLLALLTAVPAHAATICGPSEAVYRNLWRDYEEERTAIATNGPNLLELFVSKKGLTVSMLLTTPRGVSCIIVNGWDFQPVRPAIVLPLPPEKPL